MGKWVLVRGLINPEDTPWDAASLPMSEYPTQDDCNAKCDECAHHCAQKHAPAWDKHSDQPTEQGEQR